MKDSQEAARLRDRGEAICLPIEESCKGKVTRSTSIKETDEGIRAAQGRERRCELELTRVEWRHNGAYVCTGWCPRASKPLSIACDRHGYSPT